MPVLSLVPPVEVPHTPVATDTVEVSVVMPCLNEQESVGVCVEKALAGLAASGMVGEVIVCDNGSSDDSVAVARAAGASVVREPARGYGNAYMTGFRAARGKIIVMGDSDDSYDFTQLNVLVDKIGEGFDYVLGSRFGGEIRDGAMTWSHRYIGNPILTAVLNRFFGLKSSDAHSGMRAFTRDALDRMALRCEGMEFASEIVVKAARANLRVAEVPIVYHPRIGESKLNTLRDGWRHLRFLLLLSPIYLFLIPGLAMFTAGVVGQGIDLAIGGRGASTNLSILSALLAVTGVVTIIFGIFTQTFLQGLGFQKPTRVSSWLDQNFSLERNLVVSMAAIGTGLVIDVLIWVNGKSNELGGAKWSVASVMLVAIGVVILFGSFFLSIFRVRIHAIDKCSEEF
jgi:glycosyltransferase involved in cell wall biosynthesis